MLSTLALEVNGYMIDARLIWNDPENIDFPR
jgi:hypothetical protein